MRVGRLVMLVVGVVATLAGMAMVLGGGALGAAHLTQRDDDGFYTTPVERFQTDRYALTFKTLTITDIDDLPDFVDPEDVGRVRLSARSRAEGGAVFIGIGADSEVASYLEGVGRSQVLDVDLDPFSVDQDDLEGGPPAGPPDDEDIWVASASGAGTQELTWDLADGRWAVVVMNADGSAVVDADLGAGARVDLIGPLAIGLLVAGVVALAIGVPLVVVGASGLGAQDVPPSDLPPPPAHLAGAGAAGSAGSADSAGAASGVRGSPVRLGGHLDPDLSRGLWLVKWFLAIPHFIVLFFLWSAFVVLTVVAGIAIVVTGRYPRAIFDFNVGVMRWGWRVSFYALSPLGTDRYPPFTLGRTDHPATLEVAYPEHLSRGLVLVKWWLLAIPHYVVVAIFVGGAGGSADGGGAPGLIGVLTFVAVVVLLVRTHYPQSLFDLVMGLHRWVQRVVAYAALMTDEYPPFRLDMGADEGEPHEVGPAEPSA